MMITFRAVNARTLEIGGDTNQLQRWVTESVYQSPVKLDYRHYGPQSIDALIIGTHGDLELPGNIRPC